MAQARKKTPARKTPAKPVAVKRSVVRVLLLSIISGGLYGLYWFYVTREAVTKEVKGDDQVGLQTLGLIVPILNIFIIYWLLRDIDILHRKAGLQGFPALWFVLGPVIGGFIPFVNIFVGIASIVLYGLVIMYLNQYWDKATKGKAVEAKFTAGEILVSLAGLVLSVIFVIIAATTAIFVNSVSDDLDRYDFTPVNQSNSSTTDKKSASQEPKSLSGSGQQATTKFFLNNGLATFTLTHQGQGHFSATLMEGDGTYVELLANEIGSFNGSKAVKINSTGEYLIDVSADGPWTININ